MLRVGWECFISTPIGVSAARERRHLCVFVMGEATLEPC